MMIDIIQHLTLGSEVFQIDASSELSLDLLDKQYAIAARLALVRTGLSFHKGFERRHVQNMAAGF
jgi:hypothetical protein